MGDQILSRVVPSCDDRATTRPIFAMVPLEAIMDRSISSSAFRYLAFLIGVSFSNKGVSWYSQRKAGDILGLKRRRMVAIVKELEESGWITRSKTIAKTAVTQVIEDRVAQMIGAQNCTYEVHKSAPYRCKKVHLNNSKESEKMMNDNADHPGEGGQRPLGNGRRGDSSLLPDLAKQAGKKAAQKDEQRLARKKWDRKADVERAKEKKRIASWKGTKFYDYLMTLCRQHDIALDDETCYTTGVTPRYAKAMNDVLSHLNRISISNEAFAQILEKITSTWHQGTSEMFSRDGRLSVYMIRSRIQEILTRFGDRRSVQHDADYINSIPILGEEKKEEK